MLFGQQTNARHVFKSAQTFRMPYIFGILAAINDATCISHI